ncbi:MAG: putative transrane protein [Herminiimonas sp.]|nr:putative transrane protein [Herminiimonas sp.]
MLAYRLRLLLGTLWVGSLWTIGYVVAPTLFYSLSDRVLAGTIAGSLFHIEAWLGIVLALALATTLVRGRVNITRDQRRACLRLIGFMALCIVLGYFATQPFMAALRHAAGPAGVMASGARLEFGILHGVASAFYLVQSLLGIGLILKLR